MSAEGVEYTARRPVEIQADIDAATDPRVIAGLREEMRQAMEVSSVMPKELRMADGEVVDPMQASAKEAAPKVETAEEATAREAGAKPEVNPEPMTSEERIRQTNQFLQTIPVTATKETNPLLNGVDRFAPYVIGGLGAKSGYDMYANRNNDPEQVQSGNETTGDPLSRRERMRAERQQKAGQP